MIWLENRPDIFDFQNGHRTEGARRMKVIIINGPMGVGKTATGKFIAEKNPGTAIIDGDW